MQRIESLNSEDCITVNIFGKEQEVRVISTGDNQFDEEGDYKDEGFALNEAEINCLNDFLKNINIDDYREEILAYCNEQYQAIGWEFITDADLENKIEITDIAVNLCEITQSKDGFVYPEISFCGECDCDPEHGICIGFRDNKFLGIHSYDWTL